MKKLKRIALTLVVAVSGLTMTSCTESIAGYTELIPLFLQLFLQQGQTYNFSGRGTMQVLGPIEGGGYQDLTGQLQFEGTLPVTVNNNAAKLEIPEMDLGAAKMSLITFFNLIVKQQTDCSLIEVGENSTATGTLTVGSNSYEVTNLYIETMKATNSAMSISVMSIYFGPNQEYAVNVIFSGTNSQQQ